MGRASRGKREGREEREERRRQVFLRARAGETRGCIFCRQGDGGFHAKEHVFPHSMGNTDIILPNGVVCDRCNNGTLSQLDHAICEFPAVKLRRTMLGIPSKAGTVPATKFSEGTITHVGPASLQFVESQTRYPMLREVERHGDLVKLEFNWSGGRRLTPRYTSELSRALLKSAFECAWFDFHEAILEPRFDHVRAAVLGQPRDGFLAVGHRGDPNHNVGSLTYDVVSDDAGTWRMWVVAKLFGVYLATDSRLTEPAADFPPEAVTLLPFTASHCRAA